MDYEFRILGHLNLVLETIAGVVDLDGMLEAGELVKNQANFHNGLNQLSIVASKVDIQLSGDDIRLLSRTAGTFDDDSHRAFYIADNPLAFGLGRMYEQERAGTSGNVGIFTEFSEACEFVKTNPTEVLNLWPTLLDDTMS